MDGCSSKKGTGNFPVRADNPGYPASLRIKRRETKEERLMNVIWKRPDGFHGSSPEDYTVVQVANNAKIWLHKKDRINFPFRVSGGWQDEDATKKLNSLVNLINRPSVEWNRHLLDEFYESQVEGGEKFLQDLTSWLGDLRQNLKGDHWETAIMKEVLSEISHQIDSLKTSFIREAEKPH